MRARLVCLIVALCGACSCAAQGLFDETVHGVLTCLFVGGHCLLESAAVGIDYIPHEAKDIQKVRLA